MSEKKLYTPVVSFERVQIDEWNGNTKSGYYKFPDGDSVVIVWDYYEYPDEQEGARVFYYNSEREPMYPPNDQGDDRI